VPKRKGFLKKRKELRSVPRRSMTAAGEVEGSVES
jgi:hypothetical protein